MRHIRLVTARKNHRVRPITTKKAVIVTKLFCLFPKNRDDNNGAHKKTVAQVHGKSDD